MNFQDLYKKIVRLDETSETDDSAPHQTGLILAPDDDDDDDVMGGKNHPWVKNPMADQSLMGEQPVEECGMDTMSHDAPEQSDSVTMSVSMNGSGSGGIKDLMNILKNIEQGSEPMNPHPHKVDTLFGDDYENEPNPQTAPVSAVIPTGNDLASKGKEAPKVNGGGNPMQESLAKKLQEMYDDVKSRDIKEADSTWYDPATWFGGNPNAQGAKPNQGAKPAGRPDPAVMKIQQDLIAKGAKIKADGIMGPATKAAQAQFAQQAPAPTPAPTPASPATPTGTTAQGDDAGNTMITKPDGTTQVVGPDGKVIPPGGGRVTPAAPVAAPVAAAPKPTPWDGKDPAKAAAWSKLSPEDQKWLGGADPTDKYILARAPKKGAPAAATPAPTQPVTIESADLTAMLRIAGLR